MTLKEFKISEGLLLKDLTKSLGVDKATLSKYCNGKERMTPKFKQLFFDTYGVELEEVNLEYNLKNKISSLEEEVASLKKENKSLKDKLIGCLVQSQDILKASRLIESICKNVYEEPKDEEVHSELFDTFNDIIDDFFGNNKKKGGK